MLQESNIAWSSDHTQLYGDYNPTNFNLAQYPQYRGGGTITGSVRNDEHFLVWMRPGAARTVRKLYGRINSNIPAGKADSLMMHVLLLNVLIFPGVHEAGCCKDVRKLYGRIHSNIPAYKANVWMMHVCRFDRLVFLVCIRPVATGTV